MMNIPLHKLNYVFTKKPLLVGGMAMEYYGLRISGKDIDLIADEQDVVALIKMYPDRVKDLYCDLGVCPFEFEIWRSVQLFRYNDLIANAIEEKDYFVISLEKLLLLKSLVMKEEKYRNDVDLIGKHISDTQAKKYSMEKQRVENLLTNVNIKTYIEKTGPNII
ncbi:MAG: hypothetical protein AAB937_00885 [Patescibacteria group bacterium]